MEQMRENPKLRLPMKNHNYLKSVAYDLADAADAAAERRRTEDERSGSLPAVRLATSNPLSKLMGFGDE
jgi:hypothetical protein